LYRIFFKLEISTHEDGIGTFHNDVEAVPERSVVLIPEIGDEPPPVRDAVEALKAHLGSRVLELSSPSENWFQRILELFILVDYISLYASVMEEVNPLRLNLIPLIKEENKAGKEIQREVDKEIGV